jgi:hypothetical protein
MIDHYRTLGVSRTADEAAIRAAYLAAMRRYHPDQNPDPGAAERAKLITSAYTTLSQPRRRAAYDQQLVSRTIPLANMSGSRPPRGRGAFLVMSGLAAALTAFAISRLPSDSGLRPPVSEAQLAREAQAQEPALRPCPERLSDGAVRSALFGRVSEGRPSDPAAFRLAATRASLRLTTVAEQGSELLGNLRCQATLLLELPNGVTTVHGTSSMLADISFAPAGAGRGVLRLEADELLRQALLSVTTVPPTLETDGPIDPLAEPGLPPIAATIDPPTNAAPARSGPMQRSAAASPAPRGASQAQAPAQPPRVEGNSHLAALERHLVLLYNQSFLQADERKRGLLVESRASFLERLGRCSSDECRRETYLERNQQIVAIMRS